MNPIDTAVFQHKDWTSQPSERLAEGIERQMMWGERVMICRLSLAPGPRNAFLSEAYLDGLFAHPGGGL